MMSRRILCDVVLLASIAQAHIPTGEEVCEGHDFNRNQCRAKNLCCRWEGKQCWSNIKDQQCPFYPHFNTTAGRRSGTFGKDLKTRIRKSASYIRGELVDLSFEALLKVIRGAHKIVDPIVNKIYNLELQFWPFRLKVWDDKKPAQDGSQQGREQPWWGFGGGQNWNRWNPGAHYRGGRGFGQQQYMAAEEDGTSERKSGVVSIGAASLLVLLAAGSGISQLFRGRSVVPSTCTRSHSLPLLHC
eukprot:gnl/TRDRNA2_/TRDRNA2_111303_c1_seq1.p1 gnl/TRDRNA2_/TRDRNA2_111303_c1~~gnl/TRDRNA2_/TRDRNA2_111303_c1_seq1.p1  ORF type:complete len:244 (-),score=30.79 gnl/TRDRNA2_/TRDRNA2_111303_c1_seq1:95-826(-)